MKFFENEVRPDCFRESLLRMPRREKARRAVCGSTTSPTSRKAAMAAGAGAGRSGQIADHPGHPLQGLQTSRCRRRKSCRTKEIAILEKWVKLGAPWPEAERSAHRRWMNSASPMNRPQVLVLPAADESQAAGGRRAIGRATNIDRLSRRSTRSWAHAGAGSRPSRTGAPSLFRSARAAADQGAGGCVCEQHRSAGLRKAHRRVARQPALRRALGAALARPHALRGERRLQSGRGIARRRGAIAITSSRA